MRRHSCVREAQDGPVNLVPRTAPKEMGELQKCLKNATSLIRQSVYHVCMMVASTL